MAGGRERSPSQMSVRTLPYKTLGPLLRRYLSRREDPETTGIVRSLRSVKIRGYLTKEELEIICRWKSPRAIQYIRGNREKTVRTVTREAFRTRSERKKLDLLRRLSGVSVPMASAILTLTNPKRYGVIDIRVWQLLHKIGTVNTTPKGIGFTFKHWYRFLIIIRYFARRFGVTPRDIERTLFNIHRDFQKGILYPKA